MFQSTQQPVEPPRPYRAIGSSARIIVIATTFTFGVVACGSDAGGAASSTAAHGVNSTSSTEADAKGPEQVTSHELVMKTRMDIPRGAVVTGSTIGNSSFCPGGTVQDKHGYSETGTVDRTVTCSDGSLRIGFSPEEPVGNTQSGPWTIISGTGAYEGWQGQGEMRVTYDPGGGDHPTKGREVFRGCVMR